jgi:ribosomal protein L2
MCFFGLLRYSNGIYTYILLPDQLTVGDHISVSKFLLPLEKLPIGVLSFFFRIKHKVYFF